LNICLVINRERGEERTMAEAEAGEASCKIVETE
jgi:hypothetical protein